MLLDVAGAARFVALADAGWVYSAFHWHSAWKSTNHHSIHYPALQSDRFLMKWLEKCYKRCTSERGDCHKERLESFTKSLRSRIAFQGPNVYQRVYKSCGVRFAECFEVET